MKTKFIFVILFFLGINVRAQDNLLSRKLSLNIERLSIKTSLNEISEKADVKFSYNSSIINNDSIIDLEVENATVENCLDDMFDKNIRYKTSGNHIILLKAQKNNKKSTHTISGTIINSQTNEKIQYVSIYDVDEKYSTITNKNGYYKLSIPSAERYRGLCFCKEGYIDTIVVIKTNEQTKINIELEPAIIVKNNQNKKIEPIIEERTLSNFIIPQDVKINAENLKHVNDKRFFQVSLLPAVGTNLSNYGVIENQFSFNILAGYSKAVKGIEIGSLFNIVKENVKGFQLSGFGNLVGGKTTGIQTGGFFNLSNKSVNGVQLAGFANTALDTVTGIQISGFTNILKGRMQGAQVSGFFNMTTKDVDGLQISGFTNLAIKDVKLMQISGFANIGDNVNGIQATGFANVARGDIGGAQISGFSNFAKSVNFAQISGFMNIAYNEIKGVQISSFLNYAKHVKGFQLALFNVADTVSGLSMGLFSFVRKGFHQIELSANETFYANITFKTGTKKFYNIISAGIDPVQEDYGNIKNWYGGYGFGTEFTSRNKRFYFGPDLTINQVFEDTDLLSSFTSLLKLDMNFGVRIFKNSGISVAPTFNFLVSNRTDESGIFNSTIPMHYAKHKLYDDFITSYWFGAEFAIRIYLKVLHVRSFRKIRKLINHRRGMFSNSCH